MDLLRSHKRRSRLSDIAYVLLNLGLAVALLVTVRYGQSAWLAVGLVILSKWRALAVKPRFWFANIVANMVDVIVGVSMVVLLYAAGDSLGLQIFLTALYAGWLLLVKPSSRRHMVTLQAGIAVFLGVTALATLSYSWDSLFFTLFMWGIGYAAARHILGDYDEPMTSIYSLATGFLFAELGWISYHWLFAYAIPGAGDIKIPQIAIIVTLTGFAAERAYASNHKYGKVRRQDMILPATLTIAVIVVLLLFFNKIALNAA